MSFKSTLAGTSVAAALLLCAAAAQAEPLQSIGQGEGEVGLGAEDRRA